ncbi:MAG: helix-hairpin-helix domain-containing protein [Candidatus Caenarcaniphilales bacterium]|nr:helix-hairpin-helix domain-containing protein [Candidatus Caenarcaniphilales bacterium]
MDCKHLKAGLKHLKKGAYKDIPTQNQKININSVSEKELIQLKGVGPKLSKRIIEYRIEHGSFSSVDELLKVKGIGEKKLSKIKKLLNV